MQSSSTQGLFQLPLGTLSQEVEAPPTDVYIITPDTDSQVPLKYSVDERPSMFSTAKYIFLHRDFKSASRMNTVLKYVIGLDLLNCHAKFCGNTISCPPENDVWSCYFWWFSGYSRTEIVTSTVAHGQPGVTLSCMSCRVTVLALFVSVKPEARRSFG